MKEEYEYKIDNESKIIITELRSIDGFKFSMVYLLLTDKWIDIARIDNYPHEGRTGTHIHRFGEERVEFREMTAEESLKTLENIGDSIRERIKDGLYRDC